MNIEEKPYLQDLFNHMINDHGLILLESEMHDIIDLCLKQTDYNNLSAENEKLREALRELIDKVNILTYSIVEEDIEVNSDFFAETMDALAKAKQLITEP